MMSGGSGRSVSNGDCLESPRCFICAWCMCCVGNVGSRSDGDGGDVNADARGRTRSCLQRCCGNGDGFRVSDGRIDEDDDPAAVAMSADDAASSMLEEEKRNKNKINDIGIQAFDAIITNW